MSVWMDNIGASEFRRVRTVIANQSPFNGATYRSGMQDDRWQFRFDYQLLTRSQAGPLLGAIAAQRNGTGTMQVYDPDYQVRLGGVGGLGAVNGAGQTGLSLVTDGWTPSATIALASSKIHVVYTGIGVQMFEAAADIVSNSAGQATIALDAPPRGSPPDNGLVGFIFGVTGIYMNARMTGFDKQSQPGGLFSISVTGEEII